MKVSDIEVHVSTCLVGDELFLARLTQRGNELHNMEDIESLRFESYEQLPTKEFMRLPHSTLRRMSYITVIISGLSTKAMNQLRTHGKRLTFVSTSTQYSEYKGEWQDNFVVPDGLSVAATKEVYDTYAEIQKAYEKLLSLGIDRDAASYILPQGLRKILVMSGNLDDWEYVMSTRLCNRNTPEVQHIMRLIYEELQQCLPEVYLTNMLPACCKDGCKEGKFCCGKKFDIHRRDYEIRI